MRMTHRLWSTYKGAFLGFKNLFDIEFAYNEVKNSVAYNEAIFGEFSILSEE